MELKIKQGKKQKRLREPHYKLIANFMHGDADGYDEEKFTFKEKELESLKDYIMVLEVCNNIYPNGRGGCDEHHHVPEFSAVFNEYFDESGDDYEDWTDEEKEIFNKYREKEMYMYHPSYEGWSSSFDGYEVKFIDENGDKFDVKVTFTDEEIARIKQVNPKYNG